MRELPPDLANDTLCLCLRDRYGLAVTEIVFLPLGHDALAWTYRVQTADQRAYFLKVRTQIANAAGFLVPRALHDRGLTHVVAPLPTATGTLWAAAGNYAVILYPFVVGVTGMERGLTDDQWIAYGALLRRVHDALVTPELAQVLGRESYVPDGADVVRRLDAQIGTRTFGDPTTQALAALWQARRSDILLLFARAADLGQRLAAARPGLVLCHADIHTNNVLLSDDGRVWFVDWDETLLAPPERDLLFVVGGLWRGLVGPREEALFFKGYGATTVNPLALAYYRYARAISDLGYEGEQIFFRPDLGPDTRREAVERVHRLFQPGRLVELAFASGEWGA